MARTLIFFDEANPSVSMGLLGVASQIDNNGETYALCINSTYDGIDTEFDYLLKVDDERVKPYDGINITNVIEELQSFYCFDCILFPATYFGRSIAPRVAMRLKTGLTADVTSVKVSARCVQLVRPAFDGKILAGIVNRETKPLMASIRPHVFRHENKGLKTAKTIYHKPGNFEEPCLELVDSRFRPVSDDIRYSRILVSGGNGVVDSYDDLQPLARVLKAKVSASRMLVDEGIAPKRLQVGQSGKTVNCELYIAIGIFGSLQHIVGIKNVKHIIAVNTDRDAPICSLADIVVEGDGKEFATKLTALIEARTGRGSR